MSIAKKAVTIVIAAVVAQTAGHAIFAADSATSVATNNEYTNTVRIPSKIVIAAMRAKIKEPISPKNSHIVESAFMKSVKITMKFTIKFPTTAIDVSTAAATIFPPDTNAAAAIENKEIRRRSKTAPCRISSPVVNPAPGMLGFVQTTLLVGGVLPPPPPPSRDNPPNPW